jgi:hypothetical protein
MKQADTFRELFKEREGTKTTFIKAEKSLNEKKEKLWKAKEKDIHKWGAEDSLKLERIKSKLLADKVMSFKFMMAKET